MIRVLLVILVVTAAGCSASGTDEATTAPAATASTTAAPTTVPPSTLPETTTTTSALPAPNGVDADSPCLLRAEFGDPADSEYVLPFHVGEEYYMSQAYCFSEGGHSNQLAYDFDLPVGTEVLAARAGVVKGIKEDSPDTGLGYGQHNYVFIEHDDGTVAFYAHLQHDGVLVEPGDEVAAGDLIAYSGNSGLTGHPHLHFGVYRWWPPDEGSDVPVNFRNARGQLDSRNGLTSWRLYEALPVE